jgi:beta-glucosidase
MNKGMSGQEIETFVDKCLRQMTLKEKIACMTGRTSLISLFIDLSILKHYNRVPYSTHSIKRLGVPALRFSDGSRGVDMGHATCFPVSMARGASFDRNLEERIGEAIAREIRAQEGNYYGGVCINLLRHPAWGRAQETYGEAPFHLGEMGAALIRGVQRHHVMACVKHFAANSLENNRFKVNVSCSLRTLQEVYLPHFRRCVKEGVASVMGAYNLVLGNHCCESHLLLTEILRDEWGFEGFTISDFVFGVKNGPKAVAAGLDIEMPSPIQYGNKLVRKVKTGLVKQADIDHSVRRILRTIVTFSTTPDLETYSQELIACSKHTRLALEAAEKSMVLLKNDNVLPFDKKYVRKMVVIGRLAAVGNIGDHGSSQVYPPYIVTPLKGITDILPLCQVSYFDGTDLAAAEKAAQEADAVVIVAGYSHEDEGENLGYGKKVGGDRLSLRLNPEESALINALAPLNKKTAVVLISGSAIIMEEWKNSAPAILMAFYSGMEGGTALANILFWVVNPTAKLPFSIASDESHYPFFDPGVNEIEYGYYHGYTLLEKENRMPAFPFGFGMSYTRYSYRDAAVQVEGDQAKVFVTLKNMGNRVGEEVVQLYLGCEGSMVDRPNKILLGFDRILLQVGEEKTITFTINKANLAYYDESTKCWVVEDIPYIAYIGSSSRSTDLQDIRFFFQRSIYGSLDSSR